MTNSAFCHIMHSKVYLDISCITRYCRKLDKSPFGYPWLFLLQICLRVDAFLKTVVIPILRQLFKIIQHNVQKAVSVFLTGRPAFVPDGSTCISA